MRCHIPQQYMHTTGAFKQTNYIMVYALCKARTAEHGDDVERERRIFWAKSHINQIFGNKKRALAQAHQ